MTKNSSRKAPLKRPTRKKARVAAKAAAVATRPVAAKPQTAKSAVAKRVVAKRVVSKRVAPTLAVAKRAVPKKRARKSMASRPPMRKAKYALGQVVRHRVYPFRGIVFDIDPVFNNTEEWWLAIPAEIRPVKDQPYYHLLAENAETEYIAYVSEQNLLPDTSGQPLRHPQLGDFFIEDEDGRYHAVFLQPN